MFRAVLRVAATLLTLGIATVSAVADDDDTCTATWYPNADEGIAACSRLISRNPKDAASYHHRAEIYRFPKGDYDRAISDFSQAIQLKPKYTTAYDGRAQAYLDKGDYDHAISDYDQAIRLSPNWARYSMRGLSYRDKGDYDRAISDFGQAIRLNPKDPNLYEHRGGAYMKKGDYDHAISNYDQAIQLNPKEIVAYADRGSAYAGKHDYDRAISDYDQAIRLSPNYAIPYGNRGLAYEHKGDYGRAIADYDQSLKLDPNHAFAREGRDRVQALLTANRPGPVQALLPPQASPPRPAAPTISTERRVALVIGNSGYTSSLVQTLPNPRRDAKLVADALRQAGFETVELTDLDIAGMVKALQAFRNKADSADWALVYFAGHGIEVNRVNYLIPVDAKLADSRDVKHETVSYDDVAEAIGGARALRIIILDACRNNPFKAQMRQTAALRGSLDRGLAAPPETEPGTLVVYSAKEGQAAVDGDGVNSPFALAFVTRLKMPGREVRRIFDEVRDDVLEATSKRQQPYTYGSLPGSRDFFFVAGK
jgi:tetratricopeptide (TPR) repeat protein